jgi:hypothetical protein
MFRNIKLVVRNALPVRPIYRDNKIEDKNPNNGKKIISSVILKCNFFEKSKNNIYRKINNENIYNFL